MSSPERGLPPEAMGVEGEAQAEQVSATEVQEAIEAMPEKERGLILEKARQVVGADVFDGLAALLKERRGEFSALRGIGEKGAKDNWRALSGKKKAAYVIQGLSTALGVATGAAVLEALVHPSAADAIEIKLTNVTESDHASSQDTALHHPAAEAQLGAHAEQGPTLDDIRPQYEEALVPISREFGIERKPLSLDESADEIVGTRESFLRTSTADVYDDYFNRFGDGTYHQGLLEQGLLEREEFVKSYRESLNLAKNLFSDLTAELGREPTEDEIKDWDQKLWFLIGDELRMSPENHRLLEDAVDVAHRRVLLMTPAMEIALRVLAVDAGKNGSAEEFEGKLDRLIDKMELKYPELHDKDSNEILTLMEKPLDHDGSLKTHADGLNYPTMDADQRLNISDRYSPEQAAEIQTYFDQINFSLRHLDRAVGSYLEAHPDLDEESVKSMWKDVEIMVNRYHNLIKDAQNEVANPGDKLLGLEDLFSKFPDHVIDIKVPQTSAELRKVDLDTIILDFAVDLTNSKSK